MDIEKMKKKEIADYKERVNELQKEQLVAEGNIGRLTDQIQNLINQHPGIQMLNEQQKNHVNEKNLLIGKIDMLLELIELKEKSLKPKDVPKKEAPKKK